MTNSAEGLQIGPSKPLSANRSFWAMLATQFLGAFNDNLFKQAVLLFCIDFAKNEGSRSDYQPLAQELFALPFVLFSGFAGFLSDRLSKRAIVVTCKVLEVAIVVLGTLALGSNSLNAMLAVLFLLGTHSAFFGPSKFGILPELVREQDLPNANGLFLMTTFIAIIGGVVCGGKLKGYISDYIFYVGMAYVGVAACGLASSLFIRKTSPARPGLPMNSVSDLIVSRDTLRNFWKDRPLLWALLMYSIFWLIGGITMLVVNAYGKSELYGTLSVEEADSRSSLLNGFLVLGIAAGCVTAGVISKSKVNFRLVPIGCWGMIAGLLGIACLGWQNLAPAGGEPPLSNDATSWIARLLLFIMGVSAGVFTVPLQVFLQSRPPAEQKGRVIGAMNLINWIGILCSARIYAGLDSLRIWADAPYSSMFAGAALILVPVGIFYHPRTATD